jgi:exopolysaccharide production protein ExoY
MSMHLSRTHRAAAASVAPVGGSRLLQAAKRGMDILLAGSFFLFFGWAYALIAAGVLLNSGGPVIYMQPRYGKNGRVFRFYKFRTMAPDADSVLARHLRKNEAARREWQMFQKLEHDPRITRFGAFLRRYSIDEFPQFWNVLKGDMSMVGPRPCMFAQKDLYGPYWAYYCAVRPGITGLWQISGRNEVSYRRRAAMDAEYVATLSLLRDVVILLKTFRVVAGARGSR